MAKIVVVSDFSFQGSGYLNIIVPLCKGLAELGHEIKAVGLGYRGEEHDFDFSILPCQSITDAQAMTNNLKYQWGAELMLVALDIPIQGAYINLAKQLGIKIISITPLENPPLTMSWAFMLQNSDKVFFISQLGADEAQKAGVETAEHLVVGMDTKSWRLRTADEYTKGRQLFNISPDTLVVLTVADNQERKNLSKAMEIVSKVKDEGIKVKYILVTREHSEVGWKLRDLAMDYGIASELMIFERGMSFGELYSLYAISDVFLLTSKAEGLGMPVMEAMSCFTGDTRVTVTDPECGMVSKYTGKIITITTENGDEIKCTPDHPFWTSDGWQYAKNLDMKSLLLYNPGQQDYYIGERHAEKEFQNIYTGRIDSIVKTLQDYASKEDCRNNEESPQTNKLASTSNGNKERNWGEYIISLLETFIQAGLGIFGGNNRRRGDYNNQENGGKKESKLETSNSNIQHFSNSFGMDGRNPESPLNMDFQERWKKNEYGRCLYILLSWLKSFTSVPSPTPLYENKKETDGVNYPIHQREAVAINSRPPYGKPSEHHLRDKRSKYQAITEIQTRDVTEIDVYNFKTGDGVYYAEGYLVHNCGVPVVATNCGAMPELLLPGRGLIMKTEYSMIDPWGNSRRDFPDATNGSNLLLRLSMGQGGKDLAPTSELVKSAREYMESRTWATSIGQVNKSIKELLDGVDKND